MNTHKKKTVKYIVLVILLFCAHTTVCAQTMPETYLNPGSQIKLPVTETLQGEKIRVPTTPGALTAADIERQIREKIAVPRPGVYTGKTGNQKEADAIIDEQRKTYRQSERELAAIKLQRQMYNDALQSLNNMLKGKQKLSLAEAYYTIESAYGKSYLDKEEFLDKIKESADFIKTWLQQNNMNPDDAEAKHYGIQKFMSEELTITRMVKDDNSTNLQTTVHKPFHYDYEDFRAEKDFRNFFVTKLTATGTGQCNSMPALYLCLAEALNTEAYLSFAPQHSFIKYKDAAGTLHGYEPTSNWHITDRWYQDNMFISAEAKRSGIFLDTANTRQVIANCMIDLAHGYMVKFGAWDEKFIVNCITSAKTEYPRGNNIYTYFVYSHLLERKLDAAMYKNKVTKIEDAVEIPECRQLLNAYKENEKTITKLGYRPMPESWYRQLMEEHEFKRKGEGEKGRNKIKKELFLKYEK